MSETAAPSETAIDVTNLTDLQLYKLGAHREGVYRLYDSEDVLLYVGRASSMYMRLTQHRQTKEWWPQVTRKTVTWYDSHTEVRSAEALAIFQEKPVHNKRPEPVPITASGSSESWLHVISDDIARFRLESVINDIEDRNLHIAIRRIRHRDVAGVLIPKDWYEQAKAALEAAKEGRR